MRGLGAVVVVGVVVVLVGCGGGTTSTSTSAGMSTGTSTGGARFAIVADWGDLAPQVSAIVRAEPRVTQERSPRRCVAAGVPAVEGASPPTRVCTPLGSLHAACDVAMESFVALGRRPGVAPAGAAPMILACTPRPHDCAGRDAACLASAREQLAERLRCQQLDELWASMPALDLACTRDDDCTVLTSVCFHHEVARARAAPYRAVVARWGGVCLDPAGGMCPPSQAMPRCRAGRCSADLP